MGDHLPSHRFSIAELEDIEASYQCCSNANEIQPERRVVTGNEWRCYQCHNQSRGSVDDIENVDNTCPLIAKGHPPVSGRGLRQTIFAQLRRQV